MNELLLKSIQLEYETTPLTIDELCRKHKINKSDLGPTDTWTKHSTPTLPVIVVDRPKPAKTQAGETIVEDETDLDKVKTSIISTSQMLLSEVQEQIQDGPGPKDLRDLSAVLTAVKDAIIGKDPTTTVLVDNSTINNNTLVNYAQEQLRLGRDC